MRATLLAVFLCIGVSATAVAETPRQVMWQDLVPAAAPIEHPFDKLSMDQRDDIGFLARTRADLRQGFIEKGSSQALEAEIVAANLKDQGVDFERMMTAADRLQDEIKRRNAAVAPDLDGKLARMPGYALPLEFSREGVSEFLLVPYVGACIHTPPPPANQMVFVRLKQTFAFKDLYAPVWITGRMSIESSSRKLSFVDGAADISVGYALDGVTVEPYVN